LNIFDIKILILPLVGPASGSIPSIFSFTCPL
jgi:hypothetical protein